MSNAILCTEKCVSPSRKRDSSGKAALSTIADYLKAEAVLIAKVNRRQRTGGYSGLADFLTQHGRDFTAKPLPAEFRPGERGACFMNCMKLATSHARLTYCEGYAVGIIPVMHAWLLDSDGYAIDPTWTGGKGRPSLGWQYFGVAISTRYLIHHLCNTETYGPMLDDWAHGWPMLTAPTEAWKV